MNEPFLKFFNKKAEVRQNEITWISN